MKYKAERKGSIWLAVLSITIFGATVEIAATSETRSEAMRKVLAKASIEKQLAKRALKYLAV